MKKFLLAKKAGMTEIITESGDVVPVTVLKTDGCQVVGIKTQEKDGYNAILIGFDELKDKKINKPKSGFFEKMGVKALKYLKEFRVDNPGNYELKQTLGVDVFSESDKVSVSGKTIGRGFAGTIKRHNFRRGPKTHGSKSYRIVGSIGAGTSSRHVVKGKRMAGHYGDERVTIKNLKVVKVNPEEGYLLVKGAVPGKRNALIEIYN